MPSIKDYIRSQLASDPALKAEYDALAPEFAIYEQLLKARKRAKLTQAEVAERMGTTPSVVARLESAEYKNQPSLKTLRKYAVATGSRLEIRLIPEGTAS